MKHLPLFYLITLLSGCALNREVAVQTPVGPPRLSEGLRSIDGYLVVRSALDVNANDPEHNYHSRYKILSNEGALVMEVPNRAGSFLQDPATVNLSAGRYKVVARAERLGTVTGPVVIEQGRTTVVHLDGSEVTSSRRTSPTDFVRLSDGSIIGWRAKDDTEVK